MNVRVRSNSLELVQGDITELSCDAIVNAANSSLKMGGGVAGAISEKGGPSIQEECDRIGSCQVGNAVITTGGKLRARNVIHAVGPRIGEGWEDEKLKDATASALKLAEKHGLRSVAFPAISTGIFGYPKDRCAKVMLETVLSHIKSDGKIDRVMFCLYDKETFEVFSETLRKMLDE